MEIEVKKKRGSGIKSELLIFLVCLIAAISMVLYSVYNYGGGINEFIAQLHIVLLGALAIYFLVLAFRAVFWLIYRIVR